MSKYLIISLLCVAAWASLVYQRNASSAAPTFRRGLEEENEDEIPFARKLGFGQDKLRVATFGSATTWGLGVSNRYLSYPYLLSPTVDNYAFFSAGPNYPAVCTQTMVGDDALYDVIVLEYRLKATQGLTELAQRLRSRFPHALIFFVALETPRDIRRRGKNNETGAMMIESLDNWRNRINPNLPHSLLKQAMHEDHTGVWVFPPRPTVDNIINQTATLVNGEVIRFPIDDAKAFLVHHWDYFNDAGQLAEPGHEWLASTILNRTHALEKELGQSDTDLVNSQTHGTWAEPDSCHLWFTTGGCNFDYDEESIHMREYDAYRGKYALEVDQTGWIKPRNPYEEDRELYLSFLATDAGVYPKTKVTWVGADGQIHHVTLDPETTYDSHGAHLVRTVSLGNMSYGTKTVTLQPLEEAQLPFRLVGASFVGSVKPTEYDFAPIFNA